MNINTVNEQMAIYGIDSDRKDDLDQREEILIIQTIISRNLSKDSKESNNTTAKKYKHLIMPTKIK